MYQVYANHQKRIAVEVDANPRYRRLLRVSDAGVVDVVRTEPARFADERWQPFDTPRGALRYALVFSASMLQKTERAANAMLEIMEAEMEQMSMGELVAEYNRITGKSIKKFESKAAAIKALQKAAPMRNADAAAPVGGADGAESSGPATNEGDGGMATAKKKAARKGAAPKKAAAKKAAAPKKASKRGNGSVPPSGVDRAKKVAAMTKGSGGLIVKMLLEGKKDDDGIVSAVLKAFPERKTNLTQVAWYRSQLVRAGKLKSARAG